MLAHLRRSFVTYAEDVWKTRRLIDVKVKFSDRVKQQVKLTAACAGNSYAAEENAADDDVVIVQKNISQQTLCRRN